MFPFIQSTLFFSPPAREEQQLRIRNRRFDARGRFEEKARKLQISLESVPVALQASTVLFLGVMVVVGSRFC